MSLACCTVSPIILRETSVWNTMPNCFDSVNGVLTLIS